MTIPERLAWAKYHAKTAPKSYAIPQSKYRNKAQYVDGLRFDSKLEADRYLELKALQASGEVAWFLRQVPFQVARGVIYRADFLVVWKVDNWGNADSVTHVSVDVEDCKGFMTAVSRIKIRTVEDKYGIKIRILKRADVRKS